jgi:Asp-tRNA(Asn)/Glu-tRNA(Gln) amidotransferase A subunit family amidase
MRRTGSLCVGRPRSGHDLALHTLDVVDVVSGISAARFTAEDVMRSCLGRIAEREAAIKAWAHFDAELAIQSARSRVGHTGPLAGVPFGVKDVIDTAELPTEMGAQAYRGHRARYDAACVGLARKAGGILLGKTISAEFAGTQPTETANPHNLDRTPGGSSSGSAAAVADFMVPFSFGTQTGGSILRPAAFCGIVGFKPTFGLYSTAGMKVAAHSFDTIGVLARSVRDVVAVHAAMMNAVPPAPELASPRFGFFPSHLWETVEDDMRSAVQEVLRGISATKGTVAEIATPAGFESITQHRAVINAFERARGLAGEALTHFETFSAQTREVCERGFAVSGERYLRARRAVEDSRAKAKQLFARIDVLLTPTTPGEAPAGKSYAGDPRLQELWTMLHLPSITIPAGRGRQGLPLGIQLVARSHDDFVLLAHALWLSAVLAGK